MSVLYRQRRGWRFPTAVRAEGVWIWDADGRRLLDAAGGALVVTVGHGVREIADAMADQARTLAYVHGSELTSEPMERLAKELARRAPLDDARVYLVSGGSEASETAIKLARQFQVARGEKNRHKIVSRWPSYHGCTLGALAVSGRPSLRADFEPLLPTVPFIPAPYPYRCALRGCGQTCTLACAEALDEAIHKEDPASVAAFIAEPVVGASAGAVVPPPEYYRLIRETCDRHGILFIADEVMTGMGRTGRWFAMDHWGVRPDILTTGKGVTSGYVPGGAVLASGHVVDTVQSAGGFHHGFTYSHHPVVAATGLAVIRYLERHDLVARAATVGTHLLRRLGSLSDLPAVGDIRGLGLMAAIEIVENRATRAPYPRGERMAQRIQAEALARGVIVYASGGQASGSGDLMLLGPPLIISEGEIDMAVDVLGEAIAAATRS